MSARQSLYDRIRDQIDYALIRYGGKGQHSDTGLDRDAWRNADRDELLNAVMVQLQAGLEPYLDRQAIEDGLSTARIIMANAGPATRPGGSGADCEPDQPELEFGGAT